MRSKTLVTALALGLIAGTVAAQTFPSKPITIVVPASPGGAIDLAARLIGQKLGESWGQPVTIENKAGATGIIGSDFVARAAPDGHTLALVASSHAINPSMVKKLPFDTLKSFEPVAQTHVVPLMLVVSNGVPAKTVKELVDYGKAHPGKLSFASSGNGGAPHFSGELFKSMAGVDATHIPYKGSTLAHPDLISGRVSLMFDTVAAIKVQVKAGSVRPLAVTTAKRIPSEPGLPTMAEAGLPGYETSTWGGLLAPAGTPKAVVEQINAAVLKVMALPETRERMAGFGAEITTSTPDEFAAHIRSEMAKLGKVIRDANIKVN